MKLISINDKVYRVKNKLVQELNELAKDKSDDAYWKAFELARKIEDEHKILFYLNEQYNI